MVKLQTSICAFTIKDTHICYSTHMIKSRNENKVLNEKKKLTPWRRTSNAVRNVGQLVFGRMWLQLVLLGRRRVSSTSTSCHCFLLFSHSSNSNAYKTVTKPKTLFKFQQTRIQNICQQKSKTQISQWNIYFQVSRICHQNPEISHSPKNYSSDICKCSDTLSERAKTHFMKTRKANQ